MSDPRESERASCSLRQHSEAGVLLLKTLLPAVAAEIHRDRRWTMSLGWLGLNRRSRKDLGMMRGWARKGN